MKLKYLQNLKIERQGSAIAYDIIKTEQEMKVTEIHILRPALALEIGEPQAIILERISAYLKGTAHTLKGEEGKWIYNTHLQEPIY